MASASFRLRRAATLAAVAFGVVPALSAGQESACPFADWAAGEAPAADVRIAVRCLINAERARRGVRALRPNGRLNLAADRHAADMVARGYFAHVSPDGRTVTDRARHAGYLRHSHDWTLGEDIAWGTGSASTPVSIVRAFMNSAPHRRVIITRDYHDIGVGVTPGVPVPVAVSGTLAGATVVLDLGDVS